MVRSAQSTPDSHRHSGTGLGRNFKSFLLCFHFSNFAFTRLTHHITMASSDVARQPVCVFICWFITDLGQTFTVFQGVSDANVRLAAAVAEMLTLLLVEGSTLIGTFF